MAKLVGRKLIVQVRNVRIHLGSLSYVTLFLLMQIHLTPAVKTALQCKASVTPLLR
jgi:hypothetical protein